MGITHPPPYWNPDFVKLMALEFKLKRGVHLHLDTKKETNATIRNKDT